MSDASPGIRIAGRYRLEQTLGSGATAEVWRALDERTGRTVALKLLDYELARDPVLYARFEREAAVARGLGGPTIVRVLDFGVDDARPFLVMEHLEGESLARKLERGPLAPKEALPILECVADALARAHDAGLVHRDLKPDNIFLCSGERGAVKVLDFGLSKRVDVRDDEPLTLTGDLLGTPYYMSPEQAREARDVGPSADLWAFAVVAYECLTGRRPFRGDSLGSLLTAIASDVPEPPSSAASLPSALDDWFARATEKQPEARFTDARTQLAALRAALAPKSRTPAIVAVLFLVAAGVVAVAWYTTLRNPSPTPEPRPGGSASPVDASAPAPEATASPSAADAALPDAGRQLLRFRR